MSEWGSVVVRIGGNVAWTSDASRVVAMNMAHPGAVPFVLEASAAVIWEKVAVTGAVSTETLLHDLAHAFGIEQAEIHADLEALLADLVSQQLLVVQREEKDGAISG